MYHFRVQILVSAKNTNKYLIPIIVYSSKSRVNALVPKLSISYF
jgi:hypothetical protein